MKRDHLSDDAASDASHEGEEADVSRQDAALVSGPLAQDAAEANGIPLDSEVHTEDTLGASSDAATRTAATSAVATGKISDDAQTTANDIPLDGVGASTDAETHAADAINESDSDEGTDTDVSNAGDETPYTLSNGVAAVHGIPPDSEVQTEDALGTSRAADTDAIEDGDSDGNTDTDSAVSSSDVHNAGDETPRMLSKGVAAVNGRVLNTTSRRDSDLEDSREPTTRRRGGWCHAILVFCGCRKKEAS